ncbi:Hypothetical protein I595_3712 [Croceitalea dokdonensis DOKDO 023]|uniref:Uncharacterized protein n=1 Tax=Croceitalea dokdonensis DOKDO 023 TaxID=1300341 RepID=A0A0P7AMC2_9FLAO|nr:Hypothetical protein I595_3712 [Croceitalea dokdonensis DOKDO 023]
MDFLSTVFKMVLLAIECNSYQTSNDKNGFLFSHGASF